MAEGKREAREDSDVELLILVDKDKVTFEDITRITYPLYDLEISESVTISPLVYSHKD